MFWTVFVGMCSLPVFACCCGVVVPTAIWRFLWKSGSDHCDLELAIEESQGEEEDRNTYR